MIRLIAYAALFFAPAAPPADSTEVYYLVFLRPDPARKPLAKDEGERIQAAHMANIRGMAQRGVLVAAGPFDDQPTTISGIFIFRTSSLEEARRIAAQDPTVLEHRNLVEVHAWRGPKGIGDEYFRLHKEKPDTPEGMGVQPLFLIYHGPRWTDAAQPLSEHAAYLEWLHREGKLAMKGSTEANDELTAMVVFNRISDDEARRLMAADPAVKAGILQPEFHRWWCAEHVMPN
ncbi:MAG TPA: YciI family protein [Bryobacteraceae bacterium]|nr:YciI family protein [Bryobacteraceae bacterium]